jgi:hypothetical protein
MVQEVKPWECVRRNAAITMCFDDLQPQQKGVGHTFLSFFVSARGAACMLAVCVNSYD